MNLPEKYRKLLVEYDRVLNLSGQILDELKTGGTEGDLESILEKKRIAGQNIARLTQQIASSEIKGRSDTSFEALALIKDLLGQVTQKAELLQHVENQIQNLLQGIEGKSKQRDAEKKQ